MKDCASLLHNLNSNQHFHEIAYLLAETDFSVLSLLLKFDSFFRNVVDGLAQSALFIKEITVPHARKLF